MKDKTFLTLAGLFFLLFFIGVASVAIEKPVSKTIRASNAVPSALKSFAAVYPQTAAAGNIDTAKKPESIKVSVIIRDNSGNLLPNRTVRLSSSLDSVLITPTDSLTTNEIGQAVFYLTSTMPGTAKLTAIDAESNTSVANIPSVEFTE